MSEPTYKVQLVHDLHGMTLPWDARITRLSDERHVKTVYGSTKHEALQNARGWIIDEESEPEQGETLHLNSNGDEVAA